MIRYIWRFVCFLVLLVTLLYLNIWRDSDPWDIPEVSIDVRTKTWLESGIAVWRKLAAINWSELPPEPAAIHNLQQSLSPADVSELDVYLKHPHVAASLDALQSVNRAEIFVVPTTYEPDPVRNHYLQPFFQMAAAGRLAQVKGDQLLAFQCLLEARLYLNRILIIVHLPGPNEGAWYLAALDYQITKLLMEMIWHSDVDLSTVFNKEPDLGYFWEIDSNNRSTSDVLARRQILSYNLPHPVSSMVNSPLLERAKYDWHFPEIDSFAVLDGQDAIIPQILGVLKFKDFVQQHGRLPECHAESMDDDTYMETASFLAGAWEGYDPFTNKFDNESVTYFENDTWVESDLVIKVDSCSGTIEIISPEWYENIVWAWNLELFDGSESSLMKFERPNYEEGIVLDVRTLKIP